MHTLNHLKSSCALFMDKFRGSKVNKPQIGRIIGYFVIMVSSDNEGRKQDWEEVL